MKKKNLPFIILTGILLLVSLLLAFMGLFELANDTAVLSGNMLSLLCDAALVIASLSGILYLLAEAGKSVALFYKLFMWMFLFSEAFVSVYAMMGSGVSALFAVGNTISLIACVLLAACRDFGKWKTLVAAQVLIIAKIVLFAGHFSDIGGFDWTMMKDDAARLLVGVTILVMVIVKYREKGSRGAK